VEMNARCIRMGEENFPTLNLWGTLPREHFLLYLDHFGKDELAGKKNARGREKSLCQAG